MEKPERPLVVAVDLGGTKILAAVISKDGNVLARRRYPTGAEEGPERVIDRIFYAVADVCRGFQFEAISIAAAGAVDSARGVVTASPNLPGWRDIPLGDALKDRFGINTFIVHDGNAAALAEHRLGAGRGASDMVYITVSTGIGGGIIIGGKLYSGATGGAGEIGHMTIDVNGERCPCGNTGCLEMLASGKAIARAAVRHIRAGEKSVLGEMVGGQLEDITAEKVGQAAERGDGLALAVIQEAAMYLGIGFINLVNIFNPEFIVVGGGVARLGERLLEPGRRLVQERAFRQSAQAVSIVPARLGDDAGVLGAAIYARNEIESEGKS